MASFEEILNKPFSEIKMPAAFPVGTYHCLVDGPLEPGKSSQKQTDFLRARLKILSPMKDVDATQAAEQQVVGKIITHDFYFPAEGDPWRLAEFLSDSLGIDTDNGVKNLREAISEAPGKQVLVKLRHELSPDGKRVYHRVDSTAHV